MPFTEAPAKYHRRPRLFRF